MDTDLAGTPVAEDPRTAAEIAAILDQAATAALGAPSVYNSQPWHWTVHEDALELTADRSRQLAAADPDGRMLTISCGVALHYAAVTLAALGVRAHVSRLPDPARPDLLARIAPAGFLVPDPAQLRRYQAMHVRRSDRRPFTDAPVSAEDLDVLCHTVESHDTHLHAVRRDQLTAFTVAASVAVNAGFTDTALRTERAKWTHRPAGSGDGVPPRTTVADTPRQVPVRPLAPDLDPTLPAGGGGDRGTAYTLLFSDRDDVSAWLAAGEALGAVLLTGTELGLSASVMSDVVEMPTARLALRRLLSRGYPQVVVRFGHTDATTAIPPAPRRRHDDAVTVDAGPDRGGGTPDVDSPPRLGHGPHPDELTKIVELAVRAPSLHNSQPWRFRLHDGSVDVRADPRRQLTATDPDGHGIRLACGAATFVLRLGYATRGWETAVSVLPDLADPDLLARVTPTRRRPATPLEARLTRAIPRRHSNRLPFLDGTVPARSLAALREAAEAEDAWLHVVETPATTTDIAELIREATAILQRDPAYQAELAAWSRGSDHTGDGVPRAAGGPAPGQEEILARRNFGGPPRRSANRYESDPLLAVLGTHGSSPASDVRAGHALQRVLLTATDLGLAASMFSQPIEVPSVRDRLARSIGLPGAPQMVLRIGYGLPGTPTPRRPVAEVLEELTL